MSSEWACTNGHDDYAASWLAAIAQFNLSGRGSAGIASFHWRACSTFIECSSTSDNDASSSGRLSEDKRATTQEPVVEEGNRPENRWWRRATDLRTGGGGGQPTQGPVVKEGNRPEDRRRLELQEARRRQDA